MKNHSLIEAAVQRLKKLFSAYRLPFAAAFIAGLLAHGYAFTNKLLNADETAALFSKGADITSGRWGLAMSSCLFPDISMPWIYGVISLLLLSAAACVIVRIFNIKSPFLQALTAASVTVFPAQTGTFCFMYTSAPYALAVLMAVLPVYMCVRGGKGRYVSGCLMLGLSLLIYQAYISITAALFIILLVQKLLDDKENVGELIKKALYYVLVLLIALGVYALVTYIVKLVGGSGYQEYETFAQGSVLSRIRTAYTAFAKVFISGYFGFINTKLSLICHIMCAAVCALSVFSGETNRHNKLLALALLVLLPLGINSLYLIASVNIIHSVSQFGFAAVYVLTAVLADRLRGRLLPGRDAVIAALALIVVNNVFFANEVYLKMNLEYESAYAFYNTLLTQIMETPGFEENTVIDIVGNESREVYSLDRIDTGKLTGPNGNLVDSYTRADFIRNYLGWDLYLYREDIIWADWFYDMPVYPDPGSIEMRTDENRIIVKLS